MSGRWFADKSFPSFDLLLPVRVFLCLVEHRISARMQRMVRQTHNAMEPTHNSLSESDSGKKLPFLMSFYTWHCAAMAAAATVAVVRAHSHSQRIIFITHKLSLTRQ